MSSPHASAQVAGWSGFAVAAPDWRGRLAAALARESEQRRFFLWLPIAAIGGVALNLEADREPALWLPAALTLGFALAAWLARTRPLARGIFLGLAALTAGFLAMGLRTQRLSAPVLDHIRIVTLQGYVEAVDFRDVGARFVLGVTDPGDMPESLAPRRVRLTVRKTPDLAAGDFVEAK